MIRRTWSKLPATRYRWIVVAFLIVVAIVHVARRLRDPNVILLKGEGGAQWMRVDAPMRLRVNQLGERFAEFRTSFSAPAGKATLKVRGLRRVRVSLNFEPLFDSGDDLSKWKQSYAIVLNPRAGSNELTLEVFNRDGPPMALAYSEQLGIFSGAKWEASVDGYTWSAAATADTPLQFDKPNVPRSPATLLKTLPWLAPVALIGALVGWYEPRWLTAKRLCGALLVAWVVLAANNLSKLPPRIGYDYNEHVRYVQYIVQNKRLPLASEGWQMFQSPLYYLMSAPLLAGLPPNASERDVMAALRIVPMASGAAMVLLCYLAARYALPRRPHGRLLAILLGGLLPMNLYAAQNVGNEPLAGALTALAAVLMLRWLRRPKSRNDRTAAGAGAAIGMALLAKVSAALMLPLMGWHILIRRSGARHFIIFAAVCALICGWYYVRNVMHFGRPFVAGWEANRIAWWQDPGYRTPMSFVRFGRSLTDPMYAGAHGLWDGLYSTLWADGYASGKITDNSRPPWNYTLMSAGMLLSIFPTVAILAGVVTGRRNRCLRFAAACVAIYLLALIDLYLVLPVYSTVKATYLLGLTPLIAVLFGAGVQPVLRFRLARAAIFGMMVAWALISYGTYFV